MQKFNTRKMVLCAIFSAIIVAFTVVPYTGYINYAGVIEITTLHIVVILGAIALGWKYGAFFGGVWGVTCVLRALTNPLWYPFINPLISLVPRILVGLVAGLVFAALRKKTTLISSATVAALAGSLTNTVLVLTALNLFSDMVQWDFFEQFKQFFVAVVSINGGIELLAALIIAPALANAILGQVDKAKG